MWNRPSLQELEQLPGLYETDTIPISEKLIQMHFFLGGCDWYISEYGPDDRLFFGYAILNGDRENAEWGYISLDELLEVKTSHGIEVDRDLHWMPTKVQDIPEIKNI